MPQLHKWHALLCMAALQGAININKLSGREGFMLIIKAING